MRLPVEQQTRLYQKYWFPMEQSYGNEYELLFNSFMRDYLTIKQTEIPRKDGVYEAFKHFINSSTVQYVKADVRRAMFDEWRASNPVSDRELMAFEHFLKL